MAGEQRTAQGRVLKPGDRLRGQWTGKWWSRGVRRRVQITLLALIATLVVPALPRSAHADAVPRLQLAVEKYSLGNGLEVILHKDDRLPTVAINLWYHVGPANEVEGRTGFAHLFEHMMFEGSGHVEEGRFDTLLEAVGAWNNAGTSFDYTNYLIGDLPPDQLELGLWLESDRMGFLLDKLDQASLSNQQAVVRNERRQTTEGEPYGLAEEEMFHLLFPKGHPYHAAVIGSHEEIQAAQLEDVRDFFRRYYVPNNASLTIVGNIDVEPTKALVERYFGGIPRGADVPKPKVDVPTLTGEQRTVVTDEVELERVTLAYLTSPIFTPGDAEAVVAARILAGSEASRLYRKLVHEGTIAQDVRSVQMSLAYPSIFVVEATAKPGHSAGELERIIDEELGAMAAQGPTGEELESAKTSVISELVMGLENLGDFGGRADQLNLYNHYLGTPDYVNQNLERFASVTADGVRDFASAQLRRDARVVVHTVPGKKNLPPDPPAPEQPPAAEGPPAESGDPWRNEVPKPGPPPSVSMPQIEMFKLDNGLPVYLVQSDALPVVTASVVSRRGSAADPSRLPGLAELTLSLMDQGTRARDAPGVARELEALGAWLDTDAERDGSWVRAQSLKPRASELMALVADVVRAPVFRRDDVERKRDDHLVAIQQQRDDLAAVAQTVTWRDLYGPEHPYGHVDLGTEAGVRRIKRADLKRFHSQAFSPANAAIVLAGNLTRDEAGALAERAFGTWSGPAVAVPVPAAGREVPERVLIVDEPGAGQTALSIAQKSVKRSDPEFEKLLVMNQVFGGLFSSRLNQNLRETHGYTYGAYSAITDTRGVGLVNVATEVETQFTGPSVREVFNEVAAIRESSISDEELRRGKESLSRAVPGLFRTNDITVETVSNLFLFDLPPDYYEGLASRLAPITASDILDVSKRHLQPDRMKVIAVGDRAEIEPQLQGLGAFGYRNPDGSPAGP
jgi:zinc protease